MQHAPDVYALGILDVEDDIRMRRKRPRTQAGHVELVGMARRAGRGKDAYLLIGTFESVYESEGSPFASLTQVVRDGFVDVSLGLFARNDDPAAHPAAPDPDVP
jgi:hypothetical protein